MSSRHHHPAIGSVSIETGPPKLASLAAAYAQQISPYDVRDGRLFFPMGTTERAAEEEVIFSNKGIPLVSSSETSSFVTAPNACMSVESSFGTADDDMSSIDSREEHHFLSGGGSKLGSSHSMSSSALGTTASKSKSTKNPVALVYHPSFRGIEFLLQKTNPLRPPRTQRSQQSSVQSFATASEGSICSSNNDSDKPQARHKLHHHFARGVARSIRSSTQSVRSNASSSLQNTYDDSHNTDNSSHSGGGWDHIHDYNNNNNNHYANNLTSGRVLSGNWLMGGERLVFRGDDDISPHPWSSDTGTISSEYTGTSHTTSTGDNASTTTQQRNWKQNPMSLRATSPPLFATTASSSSSNHHHHHGRPPPVPKHKKKTTSQQPQQPRTTPRPQGAAGSLGGRRSPLPPLSPIPPSSPTTVPASSFPKVGSSGEFSAGREIARNASDPALFNMLQDHEQDMGLLLEDGDSITKAASNRESATDDDDESDSSQSRNRDLDSLRQDLAQADQNFVEIIDETPSPRRRHVLDQSFESRASVLSNASTVAAGNRFLGSASASSSPMRHSACSSSTKAAPPSLSLFSSGGPVQLPFPWGNPGLLAVPHKQLRPSEATPPQSPIIPTTTRTTPSSPPRSYASPEPVAPALSKRPDQNRLDPLQAPSTISPDEGAMLFRGSERPEHNGKTRVFSGMFRNMFDNANSNPLSASTSFDSAQRDEDNQEKPSLRSCSSENDLQRMAANAIEELSLNFLIVDGQGTNKNTASNDTAATTTTRKKKRQTKKKKTTAWGNNNDDAHEAPPEDEPVEFSNQKAKRSSGKFSSKLPFSPTRPFSSPFKTKSKTKPQQASATTRPKRNLPPSPPSTMTAATDSTGARSRRTNSRNSMVPRPPSSSNGSAWEASTATTHPFMRKKNNKKKKDKEIWKNLAKPFDWLKGLGKKPVQSTGRQ